MLRDKKAFVKESKSKAEHAAERGEAVYKIIEQLGGKNTGQPAPVKDKDGNNLSVEKEQATRWVQHLQDLSWSITYRQMTLHQLILPRTLTSRTSIHNLTGKSGSSSKPWRVSKLLRDSLWKIFPLYGVPTKMITLMEIFYHLTMAEKECDVVLEIKCQCLRWLGHVVQRHVMDTIWEAQTRLAITSCKLS